MLPESRRPMADEIQACGVYIERETELVRPDLLVTLGDHVRRHIFEKSGLALLSRMEFRGLYGKVVETSGKRLLPLQHPAAMLHAPQIEAALVTNYRKLG